MSLSRVPLLAWIGLLALANGLLWAALVPPWQAVDEQSRCIGQRYRI